MLRGGVLVFLPRFLFSASDRLGAGAGSLCFFSLFSPFVIVFSCGLLVPIPQSAVTVQYCGGQSRQNSNTNKQMRQMTPYVLKLNERTRWSPPTIVALLNSLLFFPASRTSFDLVFVALCRLYYCVRVEYLRYSAVVGVLSGD